MTITKEQKAILTAIVAWLNEGGREPLTLGGYAGTGKTSVIAVLRLLIHRQKPQWRVAFAAFTGKASQVLADRLHQLRIHFPDDSVSTLHALLYSPIADAGGDIAGWKRKTELPFDLIVVDEASMVTKDIWQDLNRHGVPVLAVGDHGQLPPIGESFSLMAHPQLVLEQIHRQAAESPILEVARLARETGTIPVGRYGKGVVKYDRADSDAGVLIDELVQTWKPDTLFLCGMNHTRLRLNSTIRSAAYRDPERPEAGDRVICLRNHWDEGLYNGLVGTLDAIADDRENELVYQASLVDDASAQVFHGPMNKQQFGHNDRLVIRRGQEKLYGELFDYGYALTVHKAQGSQARKVIVLEERNRHMTDEEWRRWLYTAVTRAEEELVLFGSAESLY